MRNKKLIKEETALHRDDSSTVLSPWKRKGKKEKKTVLRYYVYCERVGYLLSCGAEPGYD